jgi:hypothetical protein
MGVEPPSVRAERSDVPASLDRVLARMMARDPDDRYQRPAEVVAALTPFARQHEGAPPWEKWTWLAVVAGSLLVITLLWFLGPRWIF